MNQNIWPCEAFIGISPVNLTGNGTTTNGATIDRRGDLAAQPMSVLHLVHVGITAETLSAALYLDFILQYSDDDSAWVDVTDEDEVLGGYYTPAGVWTALTVDADGIFHTIEDSALDLVELAIEYTGNHRYSRVIVVLTGNHTSGTILAASAIVGQHRIAGAPNVLPRG